MLDVLGSDLAQTKAPPGARDHAAHVGSIPRRPALRSGARFVTALSLLASDILVWHIAAVALLFIFSATWSEPSLSRAVYPLLAAWIFFLAAGGLYTSTGISQPVELRRFVRAAGSGACVHLAILIAADAHDAGQIFSLLTWAIVVPLGFLFRSATKAMLIRHGLFGVPHVIIGTGERARSAIREMQRNPELGQVPVAAFGESHRRGVTLVEGVPVLGAIEDAAGYCFPLRTRHAIVALEADEADLDHRAEILARLGRAFPVLQVLADASSPTNMLMDVRAVGQFVALEMRQPRFSSKQRRMKRAFDLAISVPLLVVAAPIVLIAGLLVKCFDPAGPILFSQWREGIHGRPVRIWKIRTMVMHAEARLAEHLAADPAARLEYERFLKLRRDPRIIPHIGRFLRRYSLDELPQLWNVVRGDLSLVGPRVMLGHEVERFSANARDLRRDVPPGLTGLWQIQYRNNCDRQTWESADSYYVNNWSVWLDAWILLRTIRVVISGSGAY